MENPADTIRRRVDELVRSRLARRLLDSLEAQHKKHGHKSECNCDSCRARRFEIAHYRYPSRRLRALLRGEEYIPTPYANRDHFYRPYGER